MTGELTSAPGFRAEDAATPEFPAASAGPPPKASRPPSRRRRRIKRAAITIGLVFLAYSMFYALFPGWLSAPEVTVINDTNSTFWVTNCDEVGTLKPWQTERFSPVRPCSVFAGNGPGSYIGCLDIPDDVILAGGTFGLSNVDRSIGISQCNKSDRYGRLSKLDRFLRAKF